MASSIARHHRIKNKFRKMPSSPAEKIEDNMVVKSLSVPPGLEALMENLTKEVLKKQPQDICLFASEYFAKLIRVREKAVVEYQYCKTTIHDKTKKQNAPSRPPSQKSTLKDEVELIDVNNSLSVPPLDIGRYTNGSLTSISPEIRHARSEASTAEIDKLQNGFFEQKEQDTTDSYSPSMELTAVEEFKHIDDEEAEQEQIEENLAEEIDVQDSEAIENTLQETEDNVEEIIDLIKTEAKDGVEEIKDIIVDEAIDVNKEFNILEDELEEIETEISLQNNEIQTQIKREIQEDSDSSDVMIEDNITQEILVQEEEKSQLVDALINEAEVVEHSLKKRSILAEEFDALDVPDISTTAATPTPSEEDNKEVAEDLEQAIKDIEGSDGERELSAAIKIQSLWRGFKIRKNKDTGIPETSDNISENLIKAATTIQTLWRGYNVRKLLLPSSRNIDNDVNEIEKEVGLLEDIEKDSNELLEAEDAVKKEKLENETEEIKGLEEEVEEIDNLEEKSEEKEIGKMEIVESENLTTNIDEIGKEIKDDEALEQKYLEDQFEESVAENTEEIEETKDEIINEIIKLDQDIRSEDAAAEKEIEDAVKEIENDYALEDGKIIEEEIAIVSDDLDNVEKETVTSEIIATADNTEISEIDVDPAQNEQNADTTVNAEEEQPKVLFIVGPDDTSDEDDYIEDDLSEAEIAENIIDDVTNSAENMLNESNLDDDHLEISLDLDSALEESTVSRFKDELEIADEISEDLQKLKACISDEKIADNVDESAQEIESESINVPSLDKEINEVVDTESKEMQNSSRMLEHLDLDDDISEQEKIKVAEEMIMKALGLQHSGEMHDSLEIPSDILEAKIEENQDAVDITKSTIDDINAEINDIDQIVERAVENVAETKSLIAKAEPNAADLELEAENVINDAFEESVYNLQKDIENNGLEPEIQEKIVEVIDNEVATIEESVSKIANEIQESRIKLPNDIEENISIADTALTDMEITIENAQDVFVSELEENIDHLKEKGEHFSEGVNDVVDKTQESASDIVTITEEHISEAEENIDNAFEDGIDDIKETKELALDELNAEKEEVNKIINEVQGNAENLISTIEENAPEAQETVDNDIKEVEEHIVEMELTIEAAVEDVQESIQKELESNSTNEENEAMDVTDETKEHVTDKASEIKQNIEESNEMIETSISKLTIAGDELEHEIDQTAEDIKDEISNVADDIVEATDTNVEDLVEASVSEVDGITSEAEKRVEKIADEIRTMEDNVTDVTNEVEHNIEEVENKIGDAVEETQNEIATAADDVQDNLDELKEQINENVEDFTAMPEVLNSNKEELKQDIVENLNHLEAQIVADIDEGTDNALLEADENISNDIETVKELIGDGVDDLKNKLNEVEISTVDEVEDAKEEEENKIVGEITGAIPKLIDQSNILINNLEENLDKTIDETEKEVDFLEETGDELKAEVDEITKANVENLSSQLEQLDDKASEEIQDVIQDMDNFINGVEEHITDETAIVGSTIEEEVVDTISDNIEQNIEENVTNMDGINEEVVDSIDEKVNQLKYEVIEEAATTYEKIDHLIDTVDDTGERSEIPAVIDEIKDDLHNNAVDIKNEIKDEVDTISDEIQNNVENISDQIEISTDAIEKFDQDIHDDVNEILEGAKDIETAVIEEIATKLDNSESNEKIEELTDDVVEASEAIKDESLNERETMQENMKDLETVAINDMAVEAELNNDIEKEVSEISQSSPEENDAIEAPCDIIDKEEPEIEENLIEVSEEADKILDDSNSVINDITDQIKENNGIETTSDDKEETEELEETLNVIEHIETAIAKDEIQISELEGSDDTDDAELLIVPIITDPEDIIEDMSEAQNEVKIEKIIDDDIIKGEENIVWETEENPIVENVIIDEVEESSIAVLEEKQIDEGEHEQDKIIEDTNEIHNNSEDTVIEDVADENINDEQQLNGDVKVEEVNKEETIDKDKVNKEFKIEETELNRVMEDTEKIAKSEENKNEIIEEINKKGDLENEEAATEIEGEIKDLLKEREGIVEIDDSNPSEDVAESGETGNESITDVLEAQDKSGELDKRVGATETEEILDEVIKDTEEMSESNIIGELKVSESDENEVITEVNDKNNDLENADVISEIEEAKLEEEETENKINEDATVVANLIKDEDITMEQENIENNMEDQDNRKDLQKETDDAEVVSAVDKATESTNHDEEIEEMHLEFDKEMVENIENFDKALTDSIEIETKINELNSLVDSKNDVNEELNNNDDIKKSILNEEEAAIKIQSLWRGYQVRNNSEENETIELQKPAECDELSSSIEEGPEVLSKAATTIQAGVRGYLSRAKRHLQETDSDTANSGSQITVIAKDSVSCDDSDVVQNEAEVTKTSNEEVEIEESNEVNCDEIKNGIVDHLEANKEIISNENEKVIKDADEEKAEDKLSENDNRHKEAEVEGTNEIDSSKMEEEIKLEEKLDDVDELNKRLQNLSKTNVYGSVKDVEPMESLSGHIHPETENKSPLLSPKKAVNFDEFDSSRYDLKTDNLTPKSKPTSPMEELVTNAYKIGARLSINDDKIVDAIDPVEDAEERAIEYIRIPLHGPSEANEELIEKKTVIHTNEDDMKTDRSDSNPTDYIYIPLKVPGAESTKNSEEIGLQHSSEMHDSLGFPHEEPEDDKVGDSEIDNFTNSTGLVHSGEMHDSLVVPAEGQSNQNNEVTGNNEVQDDEAIEISNIIKKNLNLRNAEEANPEALISIDNINISNSNENTENISDFVLGLQHSGELHDSLSTTIDLSETTEGDISSKEANISKDENAIQLFHSSELHDSIVQAPFEELEPTGLQHSGEIHDSLALDLNLNNYINDNSSHEQEDLKKEDDKTTELAHSGEFHDSLDAMINFDNKSKTAFQNSTEFFDSLETNYSGGDDNEEYNHLYPEINSRKNKNNDFKSQNNCETLNNILEQIEQDMPSKAIGKIVTFDLSNLEKNSELTEGTILAAHEHDSEADIITESLKAKQNVDDNKEDTIEAKMNYKLVLPKENDTNQIKELEVLSTEILSEGLKKGNIDLQILNDEKQQIISMNNDENTSNMDKLGNEGKADDVDNVPKDQGKILVAVDDTEVNNENEESMKHVISFSEKIEKNLDEAEEIIENESISKDETIANLDTLSNKAISFEAKADHITEKQLQLLKEIDNKNSDSLESNDFEDSSMYDYYDNTNVEMVDTSVSTEDFNFYDEDQQSQEEPALETIPEMEEMHFSGHRPSSSENENKSLGREMKNRLNSIQIQQDITSPTKIVDEEEMYKNIQLQYILSNESKLSEEAKVNDEFHVTKDNQLMNDQITSEIGDIETEIALEPKSTEQNSDIMVGTEEEEEEGAGGEIELLHVNKIDETIATDDDPTHAVQSAELDIVETPNNLNSSFEKEELDSADRNSIVYEQIDESVINDDELSKHTETSINIEPESIEPSIKKQNSAEMIDKAVVHGQIIESLHVDNIDEIIATEDDSKDTIVDETVLSKGDEHSENTLLSKTRIIDEIQGDNDYSSGMDNIKSEEIDDTVVQTTIPINKNSAGKQEIEEKSQLEENFNPYEVTEMIVDENTIIEENLNVEDLTEKLKKNVNDSTDAENMEQDEIIATKSADIIDSSMVEKALKDEESNIEEDAEKVKYKENINDIEDAENVVQEESLKKSEGDINYSVVKEMGTEEGSNEGEDTIIELQLMENFKDCEDVENITVDDLAIKSKDGIDHAIAENSLTADKLNQKGIVKELQAKENYVNDNDNIENILTESVTVVDPSAVETTITDKEFKVEEGIRNEVKENIAHEDENLEKDTKEMQFKEKIDDSDGNKNMQDDLATKSENVIDSSVGEKTIAETVSNIDEDPKEIQPQENSTHEESHVEGDIKETVVQNEVYTTFEDAHDFLVAEKKLPVEESNIEENPKELEAKENIKDVEHTVNIVQDELAANSDNTIDSSVAKNTLTEKAIAETDTKEIELTKNANDNEDTEVQLVAKTDDALDSSGVKATFTEEELNIEDDTKENQQKNTNSVENSASKEQDNLVTNSENIIDSSVEEKTNTEKGAVNEEVNPKEDIENSMQEELTTQLEDAKECLVVEKTNINKEPKIEEDTKQMLLKENINDNRDIENSEESSAEKSIADIKSHKDEVTKNDNEQTEVKNEAESEIVSLSRAITPAKSPIEEIDEFLKRSRSRTPRTLSRQSNIDTPNRQLFDEIDSIIESYEQKRQSSAGSSPLLESLSRSSSRLSADMEIKSVCDRKNSTEEESGAESLSDLNLRKEESDANDKSIHQESDIFRDSIEAHREEINESNVLAEHDATAIYDQVNSSHESVPHSKIKSIKNIENDQKLETPDNEENLNNMEQANPENVETRNMLSPLQHEIINEDNRREIENQAAVKIQNAFKEYQSNKKSSQEELLKERSDSSETNKTYTIEPVSSPEDIGSDEETLKNKAATKIQNSYRNYRQKRSVPTIQCDDSNLDKEINNMNITDLEDRFLDLPVEMDYLRDVPHEELKDFSDITHCSDEQNQKNNYKTRSSLESNALHPSLDTIPESASPIAAEEIKEGVENETQTSHFENKTNFNVDSDAIAAAVTTAELEGKAETPKGQAIDEECNNLSQNSIKDILTADIAKSMNKTNAEIDVEDINKSISDEEETNNRIHEEQDLADQLKATDTTNSESDKLLSEDADAENNTTIGQAVKDEKQDIENKNSDDVLDAKVAELEEVNTVESDNNKNVKKLGEEDTKPENLLSENAGNLHSLKEQRIDGSNADLKQSTNNGGIIETQLADRSLSDEIENTEKIQSTVDCPAINKNTSEVNNSTEKIATEHNEVVDVSKITDSEKNKKITRMHEDLVDDPVDSITNKDVLEKTIINFNSELINANNCQEDEVNLADTKQTKESDNESKLLNNYMHSNNEELQKREEYEGTPVSPRGLLALETNNKNEHQITSNLDVTQIENTTEIEHKNSIFKEPVDETSLAGTEIVSEKSITAKAAQLDEHGKQDNAELWNEESNYDKANIKTMNSISSADAEIISKERVAGKGDKLDEKEDEVNDELLKVEPNNDEANINAVKSKIDLDTSVSIYNANIDAMENKAKTSKQLDEESYLSETQPTLDRKDVSARFSSSTTNNKNDVNDDIKISNTEEKLPETHFGVSQIIIDNKLKNENDEKAEHEIVDQNIEENAHKNDATSRTMEYVVITPKNEDYNVRNNMQKTQLEEEDEENESQQSDEEDDGSTDINGRDSEDEPYHLIISQAQKDQHPGNGIPATYENSHSLAMKTNRALQKQHSNENTQHSPDSSRNQSRSRSQGWDKTSDVEHGELDSGFARDYATDGDDPEQVDADEADDVDFSTSGIQSESSIYDGDESDAKSSPDDELGQGCHANARGYQNYNTMEERRMAPLENSGDANDTVDIFLSSEELSQAGAAMLTSGEVGGKTAASGPTRALGDAQAPSFAADTADDMEAALRSHSATLAQSNNSKTSNNSEHATTNMGEGTEHQQEANAATKIQAGFRGYQVRKQMKLKKSPSEEGKSVKRCSSGRRRSSTRRGDQGKSGTDLEEKSATKIQAGIRGFLVRKRQRNTKDKQA